MQYDDDAFEKILNHSKTQLLQILHSKPELIVARSTTTGRHLLHVAVDGRRLAAIEALVSLGADVNGRDSLGGTPLHLACFHGNLTLVKLLLKNGADPNALDSMDLTPLAVSAQTGHKSKRQVMSAVKDNGGVPDAIVAIQTQDASLFEITLQTAQLKQYKYLPHLIPEFVGMWCRRAMETSLQLGGPHFIRDLLEWSELPLSMALSAGANINSEGVFGCPPALVLAVQCSELGIQPVEFLLEHGANVNLQYRKQAVIEHAINEEFRVFLKSRGARS